MASVVSQGDYRDRIISHVYLGSQGPSFGDGNVYRASSPNMSNRTKVVSTRATVAQRAMIGALAQASDMTISDLVHEIVFPEVYRRIRQQAGEGEAQKERGNAAF